MCTFITVIIPITLFVGGVSGLDSNNDDEDGDEDLVVVVVVPSVVVVDPVAT